VGLPLEPWREAHSALCPAAPTRLPHTVWCTVPSLLHDRDPSTVPTCSPRGPTQCVVHSEGPGATPQGACWGPESRCGDSRASGMPYGKLS